MSSDNIDRIAFIFFSALTFCAIMNDSYSLFNNLFKNNYVKKKMNNLNKIKKVFIGLLFNNYTNDNEGNIIIEEDVKSNNVCKNPFDDDNDDDDDDNEYYVDYEIINTNNDKAKELSEAITEKEVSETIAEEEVSEAVSQENDEIKEVKNNELLINNLSIDDIKIYKDEKNDILIENNDILIENNDILIENNDILIENNNVTEDIEDYSNTLSYDKITIDKITINKKEKKPKSKDDKKKKEKINKEIIIKKQNKK
jgi:hypothetical protein